MIPSAISSYPTPVILRLAELSQICDGRVGPDLLIFAQTPHSTMYQELSYGDDWKERPCGASGFRGTD